MVFPPKSFAVLPFGLWRKQGADFRGSTTAVSQSSSTTITLAKPAGVVANDVLYAFVWTNTYSRTGSTATPTGWTLLGSTSHQTNQYILNVYRRVADGTEGSSFTFTFSESANYSEGVVVAYVPVDTNTPEDASVVFSVGNVSTSSVSVTGTTTATTAARVIVCMIETSRASTLTAPTGFTERTNIVDSSNAQALHVYDNFYVNPQATGTLTTTGWNTSTNRYLGAVLSVKER